MTPEHDRSEACARVRERLDAHLDGGLPRLAAERDAGHLEACVACAAERERRRAWLDGVRTALAPSAHVLAAADAGLLERLRAAPAARRSAWRGSAAAFLRRALPAGGLAAAALLALHLIQGVLGGGAVLEAWMDASLPGSATEVLPSPAWCADPLAPWLQR